MDQHITNQPIPPTNPLPNLNSPKQVEEGTKERPADVQTWSGCGTAEPALGKPEAADKETCCAETTTANTNKEQLHQRVDARMSELEVAFGQLDGRLGHGERAQAISAAMKSARNSMSGGWERVGEIEAAQLAQWLSATEDLRVTSPGIPVAKQD